MKLKSYLGGDVWGIIIIYTLSYSMMLVVTGIFWDDWCFYFKDPAEIIKFNAETGLMLWGHYKSLFTNSLTGSLLHKSIVFIFFLCSSLFVYKILTTVKSISREVAFLIVILFSIFPVNIARIAMNTVLYSTCQFLFLVPS